MLLYGADIWPTNKGLERTTSSDCRMQKYFGHVRWECRVSNEEVMRMCGVDDMLSVLRRQRLKWYGYAMRREEGHVLGRAVVVKEEGRRPGRRPKKTWRWCVEEDMKRLNIMEESIQSSRGEETRSPSNPIWENKDGTQDVMCQEGKEKIMDMCMSFSMGV